MSLTLLSNNNLVALFSLNTLAICDWAFAQVHSAQFKLFNSTTKTSLDNAGLDMARWFVLYHQTALFLEILRFFLRFVVYCSYCYRLYFLFKVTFAENYPQQDRKCFSQTVCHCTLNFCEDNFQCIHLHPYSLLVEPYSCAYVTI